MPRRTPPNRLALAALMLAVVAASPAKGGPRDSRWKPGSGQWDDPTRWSGDVPDVMHRAELHGESTIDLPAGLRRPVAGLRVGTRTGDRVTLRLGGELVARRDFVQLGEASGGTNETLIDGGALHCVSAIYLGGAGNAGEGACGAALRVRGGSLVGRVLTMGWGHGAEARLSIEGSTATAVHVLDYLTLGVPGSDGKPSTSTLAFTLDERGVTPVTIESRRTGLSIARGVAGNRCRLEVSLSGIPPRDDVTLVGANVRTQGVFDDLPEASEVVAEYEGRAYRWRLTYRGGASGCDVVLTQVRGHAETAVKTSCRSRPATPVPLWDSIPVRTDDESQTGPEAFAEAGGFGRHAAGGRGGKTVWVENLNDDGPGSFREATRIAGARTIKFRTGGTIRLKSVVQITEPFLTVDAQSAPGEGITFVGDGFFVRTHDVVLRHFRVRPGDHTRDTDALNFHDAQRCIADHLSLGWATDEVLSVTGLSDRITVQWCVISEGLNRDRHGYASILAGERVTWHHNLMAHHTSRVPRFAGIVQADFRNNVLYNWGHTAGYGQFERVNYVGNFLKPGPSSTLRPPLLHLGDQVVGPGTMFVNGNVIEGHAAATRDNWLAVGFDREVQADQPFAAPPLATTSAEQAWKDVLSQAGALPDRRDATDERVVRETRTGTGRIINTVGDLPGGE